MVGYSFLIETSSIVSKLIVFTMFGYRSGGFCTLFLTYIFALASALLIFSWTGSCADIAIFAKLSAVS